MIMSSFGSRISQVPFLPPQIVSASKMMPFTSLDQFVMSTKLGLTIAPGVEC
jgi:hypothetical protein